MAKLRNSVNLNRVNLFYLPNSQTNVWSRSWEGKEVVKCFAFFIGRGYDLNEVATGHRCQFIVHCHLYLPGAGL